MRGRWLWLAAAVALALAGCDGSDGDQAAEQPPATTGTATQTEAERPDEPRVGDGRGGIRLRQLGTFDEPVYVTQAPAGDPDHLYVVERCGTVQRVLIDGGGAESFLDLSDLVTCEGTEQGLLSVAFAPDYRRSGLLYVYYTDTDQNQTVVEYRAPGDRSRADPGSAREVLAMEDFAANHNGGLLLFGPDDALYVGTGDGGGAGDPERNGQDLSSLLGKILRIDPRPSNGEPYGVPEDNPHTEDPGARPEIAVHGLRNPWRFSFDRDTRDLWIGDVGQDDLEEIDSARFEELTGLDSGLNFGWSAFEGTQEFNQDQRAPGARPPVLEYPLGDACAVTGGHVVRDPELRSLYGRYLYGDFCLGQLRSFTARAGRPARDDRELGVEVAALSSFGEDVSGRIYATSLEGPVYRLVPDGGG